MRPHLNWCGKLSWLGSSQHFVVCRISKAFQCFTLLPWNKSIVSQEPNRLFEICFNNSGISSTKLFMGQKANQSTRFLLHLLAKLHPWATMLIRLSWKFRRTNCLKVFDQWLFWIRPPKRIWEKRRRLKKPNRETVWQSVASLKTNLAQN